MERNKVILVDAHDQALGLMDKMEAHLKGELHRAFSVFIFNDAGELLMQQRALHKYHGAGLWTNTCCSHPQWGEKVLDSAHERLSFEMGLACELQFRFAFIYKAAVENDLMEHEYDHVFFGYSNAMPQPNPDEVVAYRWMSKSAILAEINDFPERFTYWFKAIICKIWMDKPITLTANSAKVAE